MKLLTSLLVALVGVCVLGACKPPPASETVDVVLEPISVGTKSELYEVTAPNKLKLAPGIKYRIVDDLGGRKNVIMLLREDGRPAGGFVTCECSGASQGSCTPSSDNPDNDPVCNGGCTNDQGNPHPCGMRSNIGPPRDPRVGRIRFVNR